MVYGWLKINVISSGAFSYNTIYGITLFVGGSYMNTVQIVDCFYIEVRGEISHKFMRYCLDNRIAPLSGIGTSGPNIHTGCYLVKDKEKGSLDE